jgi:pyruvate/2-oxoglutarate dehydrogenase complex dihydrolipoamide acyltransferase (E2) component
VATIEARHTSREPTEGELRRVYGTLFVPRWFERQERDRLSVREWLVKPGEAVARGQTLAVLATRRGEWTVAAPAKGVFVREVKHERDLVGLGETLGYVEIDPEAWKTYYGGKSGRTEAELNRLMDQKRARFASNYASNRAKLLTHFQEVKGDLVDTLTDVSRKRASGEIPAFDRILIETTGLADPVPIVQTIVTDTDLSPLYRLDTVIGVVDAVHALAAPVAFGRRPCAKVEPVGRCAPGVPVRFGRCGFCQGRG